MAYILPIVGLGGVFFIFANHLLIIIIEENILRF